MQIVRIGDGKNETPTPEMVGGKAANLARMAALGLPVPPAFVLPVDLCAAIVRGDGDARNALKDGLKEGIAFLEEATGKQLGDTRRPLLVSVRSGAARSMPGMLDTVLDVGCTPGAVTGLVRMTGNPRFAWDCRWRFLESFASVVLGLDGGLFERQLAMLLATEGVADEELLDGEALERLAVAGQEIIAAERAAFSEVPTTQLLAAAEAVYRSWMSPRAQTYRKLEHLEYLEGTAVTVQAMVFGNRGHLSGAGVAFSRNPSTGTAEPVIDVLFEAQGEDVVSGRRTPQTEDAIRRLAPKAAEQLRAILAQLETAFGDVQDVEFTIEDGRLWILQTRSAKRTPQAALKFAVDFVDAGVLTPLQGLKRLEDVDLTTLVHRELKDVGTPAASGTGACAGVAVGRAAFSSESAERLAGEGEPVILLRPDTSTSDVAGFAAAQGIVTARGGRTAHAALVARQMGKPCIVGCAGLVIDAKALTATLGGTLLKEGDWVSVDGDIGAVYLARGTIETGTPDAELGAVARWREMADAEGAERHSGALA